MDFLDDSLEDEILLQADDPPANAPVNTPANAPVNTPTNAPVNVPATHLPANEPLASGLEPVPSPTSSLPIGDLAIQSPQERGKGKPLAGNRLSQEPVDPQITIPSLGARPNALPVSQVVAIPTPMQQVIRLLHRQVNKLVLI